MKIRLFSADSAGYDSSIPYADPQGTAELDRTDLEPLFFLLPSSLGDAGGAFLDRLQRPSHMAYYNVLFDRCVDEAYELLGIGPDYVKAAARSSPPKSICAICASCMPAIPCG
jgi:hypothetical protein